MPPILATRAHRRGDTNIGALQANEPLLLARSRALGTE
jgi:hypothetical protein